MSELATASEQWASADVVHSLRLRHVPSEHWAFFEELRYGTGFRDGAEQRIDAWAMNMWPSSHFERISYEIKISRSDFLREIKDPLKRRLALLVSNRFYFAAPTGLIKRSELPPECGLVEIKEGGNAFVTVSAPWRDTGPAAWMFVASICRRVQMGGARP